MMNFRNPLQNDEHIPPEGRWCFDTETFLIAPGLLTPTGVCLTEAWADELDNPGLHALWDGAGLDRLEDVLKGCGLIIGQNVAFDFAVCANLRPSLVPLIFQAYCDGRVSDVMIREMLLDLSVGKLNDGQNNRNRRYNMATLWERYTGENISEDKNNPDAWRLRYGTLHGVPLDQWPQAAKTYALGDATKPHVIWAAQVNKNHEVYLRNGNEGRGVIMRPNGRLVNEEEQMAAAWALHLQGCWGVRTDGQRLSTLATGLQDQLRTVHKGLWAAGVLKVKKGTQGTGYSKDMAVIKKIVVDAYQGAGLDVPRTAPSKTAPQGNISTNHATYEAAPTAGQPTILVDDTPTPVLKALASISTIEHNLDVYVDALMPGAGRPITPKWNVLMATGRTSCEKPSLMLPKEGGWRECLQPRPGNVFINADYSTIELRALAQVCLWLFGQSSMAEAINEGKDLHYMLAADSLGITYEEILEWAAGAHGPDKKALAKSRRQMAKVANFGYPGGLGAQSFVDFAKNSYELDLTADQGEELKHLFLARWQELKRYFARVNAQLRASNTSRWSEEKQRHEKTFTLTQLPTGRVRGGAEYCSGCNSYFQGLTGDGVKLALFYVQMECYTGCSPLWTREEHGDTKSTLFGARAIILAHDEIVLEYPGVQPFVSQCARRLSTVMVEAMQVYIPDVVILADPCIMARYSKAAESKELEDGTLSIWQEPTK